MQQIALDIGLITGPTFKNFLAGPNEAALRHIELWVGKKASAATRSPVPCYLWGSQGSGKTHLLKAAKLALREQDATVGWIDAADFNRRNDEFLAHYKAGTLDIHAYVRFATEAMRRQGAVNSQAAHALFMRTVVLPSIRPQAL